MIPRARPSAALVFALGLGCAAVRHAPASSAATGRVAPTCAPREAPRPGRAVQFDPVRLQETLQRVATAAGLTGVVATVRAGAQRWTGAVGVADLATGRRLEAATPLRVASLTKPFVAAVALQLVAAGRLTLDDPVTRWLPELALDAGVTLRALLGHTSGLGEYFDAPGLVAAALARPTAAWSPAALVAAGVALPRAFPAGQGFAYSNTNYVLVGMLVERVTGTSVAAAIRQRIVAPLGLARTWFPGDGPRPGDMAQGYTRRIAPDGALAPDGGQALRVATDAWSDSLTWTAGALVATADDVTDFLVALLEGRVVPEEQLAQMRCTVPAPSLGGRARYGLGLQLVPTADGAAYGHGGDTLGYRAMAVYVPAARLAITVLANDDASRAAIERELIPALRRALAPTDGP